MLFAWDEYYPAPPTVQCKAVRDTPQEAVAAAEAMPNKYDWYLVAQVGDRQLEPVVDGFHSWTNGFGWYHAGTSKPFKLS